jgi:FkbM family methyltransferase
LPSRLRELPRKPRPIRYALSRLIVRSGPILTWHVMDRGSYRLRLYPTAYSAAIWYDRNDLTGVEPFLQRYLREGDVVIDVGANIGTTALTASSVVGGAGLVLAIEAHPRTHRYLLGNIRLNRRANIEAVNCAAGDREGVVLLSNGRSDDMNSVSDDGIEVPVRRLDSLAPMGDIALLKVDVEGYEFRVLNGSLGILDRIQCVVFEALEDLAAGQGGSVLDSVRLLETAGFDVLQLWGPDKITPFGDRKGQAQHADNLIATRNLAILRSRMQGA